MSRPKIVIHNAATGETVEREMNDEEFAQYEADKSFYEEQKLAEEAAKKKEDADQKSMIDKLKKLGLTDNEIEQLRKNI